MADTKALRAFVPKGRESSTLSRGTAKQYLYILMYSVYILRSLKNPKKTYVGLTIKDKSLRLDEHNKGLSRFTKVDRPWELIYFENFYCKLCSEKREQFLKSGFGYRFRKMILENYDKLR